MKQQELQIKSPRNIMIRLFFAFSLLLIIHEITEAFLATNGSTFKLQTALVHILFILILTIPFFLWLFRYMTMAIDDYKKFYTLIENSPIASFILQDGHVIYVNHSFQAAFGYTIEDIMKKRYRSVIHSIAPLIHFSEGKVQKFMSNLRTKNGEIREVQIFSKDIIYKGKPTKIGKVIDITEKNRVEKKLKEYRINYQSLFEYSMDSVYTLTLEGIFTSVNRIGEQITGYSKEELIGMSFKPLIDADDLPIALDAFEQVINGSPARVELKLIHKSGQKYNVQISVVPIVIEDQITGVLGFARDITEEKKREETIRSYAFLDPLTHLPNRRLFQDRLQIALSMAKEEHTSIGVMYIDLDRFKLVNDVMGHPAGDQLLVMAAKRLQACLKESDTLARLGGDEFAVLVTENVSQEHIIHVAKTMIQTMKKPFEIDHRIFNIGASIGIAFYPEHGEDVHTLIKNADVAMYHVKQNGKSKYHVFTTSLQEQADERALLEQELFHALRDHQFKIFYQPRISCPETEIVAAEALIRWEHPKLGLVSPQKFIPIAEESGLIIPMGEWIIRNVCLHMNQWLNEGHDPIRVSINVSMKQLNSRLVDVIQDTLRELQLDPAWLEIEITESTLMNEERTVLQSIMELKKLGLGIAIDDFGTGYSSLGYLKKFNVNTIKIDKTFIKNLTKDKDNYVITAAMIQLSHSLGMRVVTEGVETEEEYQAIVELRADELQGYYFCKPMPEEPFKHLIKDRNVFKK